MMAERVYVAVEISEGTLDSVVAFSDREAALKLTKGWWDMHLSIMEKSPEEAAQHIKELSGEEAFDEEWQGSSRHNVMCWYDDYVEIYVREVILQ